MKPYSKATLDVFFRACNYRFSRARRISENVFGILSCKWRVLLSTIALHPEKVRRLCLGILTLHNWLRSSKFYMTPTLPDRTNPISHEIILGDWRKEIQGNPNQLLPSELLKYSKNPTLRAKQVRDDFNLQGAVPWQWELCMNSDE